MDYENCIICFGGEKGSGKSTASTYLKEKHNFKIKSYASKLKELITTLLSFDQECYDVKLKEKVIPELGVSPRDLMQKIGTELFRETLPKVLPNFTLCKNRSIWINLLKFDTDRMTIDDIRFKDEYENVSENKGLCIRIYKEYPTTSLYKTVKSYFKHLSESSLPLDIQILNDGNKEDLYEKIDTIVDEWNNVVYSGDFENEKKIMLERYQIVPRRTYELEVLFVSILISLFFYITGIL